MKYQISDAVRVEELNGEVVVLDSANAVVHRLQGDAATVVRAVQAGEKLSAEMSDVARDLVSTGILEASGMSRRSLIQGVAASAAVVGVSSVSLPVAAAASSPDDEAINNPIGTGPSDPTDTTLTVVPLVSMVSENTADITIRITDRQSGFLYQYRTSSNSATDSGGTWASFPSLTSSIDNGDGTYTVDATISGQSISAKQYVQVRKRLVGQPNPVVARKYFTVDLASVDYDGNDVSLTDVSIDAYVGGIYVSMDGATGGRKNNNSTDALDFFTREDSIAVRANAGVATSVRSYFPQPGGAGGSAGNATANGVAGVNLNDASLNGSAGTGGNGSGGGGSATMILVRDGSLATIAAFGVNGGTGNGTNGGAGGSASADVGDTYNAATSDPGTSQRKDATMTVTVPVIGSVTDLPY